MNALCQKCDGVQPLKKAWIGGEAVLRCASCEKRSWEGECAYKDTLQKMTKTKSAWCKYSEQCAKLQVEIDGEKDFSKQKKLNAKLAEARRKQALAEQEVGT